jgi:hypothetical protein
MSKIPPHRATAKQSKWHVGGWLVNAYTLDDNATPTHAFFRNAYLNNLGEQLRSNLLFRVLRGEFGSITAPRINRTDIEAVWNSLIEHGYLGRNGAVMTFYVDQEIQFWNSFYLYDK